MPKRVNLDSRRDVWVLMKVQVDPVEFMSEEHARYVGGELFVVGDWLRREGF